MKIHHFLILGCLAKYLEGISVQLFFKRLQTLYPTYFQTIRTFYHHIKSAVEQGWIQAEYTPTIPSEKIIFITNFGLESFIAVFQPLALLHIDTTSEESPQPITSPKKFFPSSKLFMDLAEQMDLVEFIKFAILDFTTQDIEKLSKQEAMKLEKIATRILQQLAKTIDMDLEK